jgi:hypothetical protein
MSSDIHPSSTSDAHNLVFRGDIVLGFPLEQVKQNLQKVFAAEPSKIDALFSGRPVVLKRNLDLASAKKYQTLLERAGAITQIIAANTAPSTEKRTAETPVGAYAWTLAPVGMNLLRAGERRRAPLTAVQAPAFSLKSQEGLLLEAHERETTPIAIVIIPTFGVAPVGETLLADHERAAIVPQREAPSWDVAPVGASLGIEIQNVAVVTPDISHLTLID